MWWCLFHWCPCHSNTDCFSISVQGANFNQWTNLDYSVFANLVVYCNDPAAETSSRTEHEVGCKVDKTESTPAKFFPFRYYMTYAKTKFENSFFNPCEGSLIFIYNCYDGGYMGPEITGKKKLHLPKKWWCMHY